MDELAPPLTRPKNAIRWTARIIGTLFVIIYLAFFIPDAVQKGRNAVASDRIPMTIFLFLSFVGLIMAWKWEGTGGILALGSIIVFTILGFQSEIKPGATILICAMYALPAFLFLLYWWQTRRQNHPKSKKTIAA
jgi:hypothetical protein